MRLQITGAKGEVGALELILFLLRRVEELIFLQTHESYHQCPPE